MLNTKMNDKEKQQQTQMYCETMQLSLDPHYIPNDRNIIGIDGFNDIMII